MPGQEWSSKRVTFPSFKEPVDDWHRGKVTRELQAWHSPRILRVLFQPPPLQLSKIHPALFLCVEASLRISNVPKVKVYVCDPLWNNVQKLDLGSRLTWRNCRERLALHY